LTLDPDDLTASLLRPTNNQEAEAKHGKKTGKLTMDFNFYDVLISQSCIAAK
jgi:hypothetical protein